MSTATVQTPSDSVEALSEAIGKLVDERQRLRATTANDTALEANRRAIAELQQRLSRALIQRYLPALA